MVVTHSCDYEVAYGTSTYYWYIDSTCYLYVDQSCDDEVAYSTTR